MFTNTFTDNYIGTDGRLYLKVLAEVPTIPAGTHRYLASGRDKDKYVLVTVCQEKPYLFVMEEAVFFSKLHIDPFNCGYMTFIVEKTDGHPVTMRMHDERNPHTIHETVDTMSLRLYALRSLGDKAYKTRPVEDKKNTQTVALCDIGPDPFIVLEGAVGSSEYLLMFVPKAFTETIEWTLAQGKPSAYELMLTSEKCLRYPTLCKNISD
jgi:hypothetical protein